MAPSTYAQTQHDKKTRQSPHPPHGSRCFERRQPPVGAHHSSSVSERSRPVAESGPRKPASWINRPRTIETHGAPFELIARAVRNNRVVDRVADRVVARGDVAAVQA